MLAPVELAGAGGVLIGIIAACAVLGGLLGWMFDASGIGLAIGAFVGIPVGTALVYRRYRRFFT